MNIKCIFGVIHQLNQQIGKKRTKPQTVYKVVFSPSNRSTYVVIKKKTNNQTKTKRQTQRDYLKPTKTNL